MGKKCLELDEKAGEEIKKIFGSRKHPERTLQIGKLFYRQFHLRQKAARKGEKKFSPFKKNRKAFSWLAFKTPDKSAKHLSSMRELEIIELRRNSKQQVVDI